jgi:uncharacterized membrane protein (UPF0127 family)
MESLQPVWLVSEGRALASAMRATSRRHRRRGLLGVDSIDQPLVIDPCNWVHTVGMKAPIDVVYVAHDQRVIAMHTMRPWRIGPYEKKAHIVVEAAAGSIERWNLHVGEKLEVRNVEQ